MWNVNSAFFEGKKNLGTSYEKAMPKKGKRLTLKKLASDVKALKGTRERKFVLNTDVSDTMEYDADKTVIIYNSSQGDDDIQHVGDHLHPTSIEGNFVVITDPDSTTPDVIRVVLFRSKQRFIPNTAVSAGNAQALFETAGSALAPLSTWDTDNRTHFQILKDWHFTLSPTSGKEISNVKKFRYVCPKSDDIHFDQGTAVAERGQYYFCWTSNKAAAANPPIISYYIKARFTDS